MTNPDQTAVALVGEIVTQVSLPSGGSAVLRDARTLKAKDKRHVVRNISDAQNSRARGLDLVEGVLCMLVERWDVPYLPQAPLPRDQPAILDELSIADYDELLDKVGPAVKILFPDPAPSTEKGSPTGPAGG